MDWINRMQKISNKFKFQLFGRNFDDLENIYSKSLKYDTQATGTMSDIAFNQFLNSVGVFLTTQQLRIISDHYAETKSKINYIDFIQNVRKDISEKRLATIQHAWNQLSNNGVIPLQTLLSIYDSNKHPHFRARIKTAEVLRKEFQQAIYRRSADKTNINQNQFFQYWFDVNATIPNERQEYFIDIVISCLGINDSIVTPARIQALEINLYERIRQKTYIKSDEGNAAKRAFRYFDLEDRGVIDLKRFSEGLDKLGCKYLEKQTAALFAKHSKNQQLLTYEEFCGLFLQMGSGIVHNKNPVYEMAEKSNGFITSHGMTKILK